MLRLTRAQVREIDRRAIEEYHIPGIVLMENAARALTDVAIEMLGGMKYPSVLIVCGGGNNGGDGLAAARHLHNKSCNVTLLLATDPNYRNETQVNWQIVRTMRLKVTDRLESTDLLIDTLYG